MLIRRKGKARITGRQRVKVRGFQRFAPFLRIARQTLLALAIAIVCVAVSAFGAVMGQLVHHFLMKSDYFRLRRVETTGISNKLKEELFALTGLNQPGQFNLFRLDAGQLRQTILTHPKLRRATVAKRYPSTLTIEGEERTAVAVVSSGGFYAIDDEAIVLGRVDILKDESRPAPFISGVPAGEIVSGKPIAAEGVGHALDLLAALKAKNRPLYQRVSEIHVSQKEGLTLYLRGGIEARFGRGSPIDKLPRLEFYLEKNPETKATQYVDLRFDKLIISKPVEPLAPPATAAAAARAATPAPLAGKTISNSERIEQ